MSRQIADMPMTDYIADEVGAPTPTLNSSLAHTLITRSPAHAWLKHPKLNPDPNRDDSRAADLGSAAHALLLEGLDVIAVGPADDWRTNYAREARDQARAEGKIPLLAREAEAVRLMVECARAAIERCPELDGIGELVAETTYVWEHHIDEGRSVWLRTRPDLRTKDSKVVISYKSTATIATPDKFTKLAIDGGYHMQGAFEMAGPAAVNGEPPSHYIWCVQEIQPPFAVALYGMAPEFRAFAEDQFDVATRYWHRCLTDNRWPGYSQHVRHIDPPSWVLTNWESDRWRYPGARPRAEFIAGGAA